MNLNNLFRDWEIQMFIFILYNLALQQLFCPKLISSKKFHSYLHVKKNIEFILVFLERITRILSELIGNGNYTLN